MSRRGGRTNAVRDQPRVDGPLANFQHETWQTAAGTTAWLAANGLDPEPSTGSWDDYSPSNRHLRAATQWAIERDHTLNGGGYSPRADRERLRELGVIFTNTPALDQHRYMASRGMS